MAVIEPRLPPRLRDPEWVGAILEWGGTILLTRIILTSAYWVGGIVKLADFPAAVAEQAHFGLQPAVVWAALAIIVEIIGPVMVIAGRGVWLGAGALGVLTLVATLVADPFWTQSGHAQMMLINGFLEHLGLIAGLVMAALLAERDAASGR